MLCYFTPHVVGLPGGTSGKELPPNAGHLRDTDSILGSSMSLGGGNGNPL